MKSRKSTCIQSIHERHIYSNSISKSCVKQQAVTVRFFPCSTPNQNAKLSFLHIASILSHKPRIFLSPFQLLIVIGPLKCPYILNSSLRRIHSINSSLPRIHNNLRLEAVKPVSHCFSTRPLASKCLMEGSTGRFTHSTRIPPRTRSSSKARQGIPSDSHRHHLIDAVVAAEDPAGIVVVDTASAVVGKVVVVVGHSTVGHRCCLRQHSRQGSRRL